jgi:hypothetical protein
VTRWTLVGTGAERGVVRRHPLTIEGEEIGSLLITITCGEEPLTMKLRYWETRRLASADDVVTRAVMGLGRERVPLTVESSRPVGGRLESIANATVPTAMVAKLLASNQASIGVGTLTKSKQQTAIRLGTTGLGQALPQLAKECPR